MGNIAVRVRGLGKHYKIGAAQAQKDNFREVVGDILTTPIRRMRNLFRGEAYGAAELSETIWALKDVSFEVQHGEVLGIIGHNGAGKSTLLKILSQITEPSEGVIELYGRVGALLEVGTGFHQELTGRENVYLNGAILGMSRAEIDRKFDEIVDFSGIEKFIDTPVKHYSSGMGLRLGFAVAAHLEPEILVVDEVLAVGDAEFQKKCLGKMNDVANTGRTVLFVSHNLVAIQQLCTRAIVLKGGMQKFLGKPQKAVKDYLKGEETDGLYELNVSDDTIEIIKVYLHQDNYKKPFRSDIPIIANIEYEIKKDTKDLLLGFDLVSDDGIYIYRSYDSYVAKSTINKGVYHSQMTIPKDSLQTKRYYLELVVAIHQQKWITRGKLRIPFEVIKVGNSSINYPGLIQNNTKWNLVLNETD